MKVKFLKKHVQWKQGEEAEFSDGIGQYLIRCHVAESADADPEKTESILMNHLKEISKKKSKKIAE